MRTGKAESMILVMPLRALIPSRVTSNTSQNSGDKASLWVLRYLETYAVEINGLVLRSLVVLTCCDVHADYSLGIATFGGDVLELHCLA